MWIDTHAHLYSSTFDEDRDEMISRAFDAGVDKIILPNIDYNSIASLKDLCAKYPGAVFPALGLHPCSVDGDYQEELEKIKIQMVDYQMVAIGEIGLDLYWDKSTKEIQLAALKEQVAWAVEMDLPIIIHARDSLDDLISFFTDNPTTVKGVFHCFTGNVEQGRRIIDLGFYLGIGGVATFKNSQVKNVVKELSLDRIILETDAPYLSPVPYRGKRNESAYIPLIGDYLAKTLEMSLKDLAKITTKNAKKLFGI